MNREKQVVAYAIQPEGEYRVNLSRVGVEPDWPVAVIWDVAKREMVKAWGIYPDCWSIEG
jgi:hypothetical protein